MHGADESDELYVQHSGIKLGPDGELEEPVAVPELGTYRRSRLKRMISAIFVRRDAPPRPDAETLNRYLARGLTTHPIMCRHCGAYWPAGSKPYCINCGRLFFDPDYPENRLVWGIICGIGVVMMFVSNLIMRLNFTIGVVLMIVGFSIMLVASVKGKFGRFGNAR